MYLSDPVTDTDMVATGMLLVLLVWISVVDVQQFRIPNTEVYGLAALGLAYSGFAINGWPLNAVIGAICGFGVFAALGEVYYRRTGQDGLGLGDAKLLGAAGCWLGWLNLPYLVAMAAISALIYALIMRQRRMAFGPWLAASFLVLWLIGIRADG